MSENVGASTSRNPKGLHGLYGDNFTLPLGITQFSETQNVDDCRIARHVAEWNSQGKRRRGRSVITWKGDEYFDREPWWGGSFVFRLRKKFPLTGMLKNPVSP
jgi:hypothetical protein